MNKRTMNKRVSGWLTLFVLAATPAVQAMQPRVLSADRYSGLVLTSAGHPNEQQRWHGIWAYENGRFAEALAHFQRSALYGDKFSQHVLTLMYWQGNGNGAGRDPVTAYIWADLAAERGGSMDLLEIRERIWSGLTRDQQRQAIERGRSFYERYGDDVAKPRNDAEIRRFARQQTGSRVGMQTSRLQVNYGRPDLWASGASSNYGPNTIGGDAFYSAERTRPHAYWASEDAALRGFLRQVEEGNVDVGPLQQVPGPGPER